jgi:hypothetical protein
VAERLFTVPVVLSLLRRGLSASIPAIISRVNQSRAAISIIGGVRAGVLGSSFDFRTGEASFPAAGYVRDVYT